MKNDMRGQRPFSFSHTFYIYMILILDSKFSMHNTPLVSYQASKQEEEEEEEEEEVEA